MDWQECNLKKLVKSVGRDDNLIKSLLESAEENMKVAESIAKNERSYSSVVTLSYDSLRMLLEALALQNRYKIYNHECYACFLKENLNRGDLADKFDPVRLIRNSINYYGKRLNKDEFQIVYDDIMSRFLTKTPCFSMELNLEHPKVLNKPRLLSRGKHKDFLIFLIAKIKNLFEKNG